MKIGNWTIKKQLPKTIKTFLNLISYVSCYGLISRNEGV